MAIKMGRGQNTKSTGRGAVGRLPRAWRAMGGARGVGIATLTGGLLTLAYPSPSVWPLALFAYTPLLAWIRGRRAGPGGAALLGLWAGTVLHAAVFAWIADTMIAMSGLPAPVALLVLLIYAVAMGVHQVAVCYAAAVDVQLGWAPRWWWLRVAGYLLAAEVIIPFQFPWFLGNALYVAPWLHQAADIIGIVGVSALAMAVSAVLAQALVEPTRRWRWLALAGGLVLIWGGYGSLRIAQIEAQPTARTLRALIVQHNPTLDEKRSTRPAPRIPMFERARARTLAADRSAVDLVLWSEGALPFFYVPTELDAKGDAVPGGRANALLRRITREVDALGAELGLPFLFGSLRRLDPSWSERARNSAIVLRPGQPRWVYDKRILVPFGERMPGRDLVPGLADAIPGVSNLGAGDGPAVVDVDDVRLGLSICYEALFADHMVDAMDGADVLVNLTDDVWFGPTNAPELHLMVQTARSVELRRPLLRATATGVSASVDACGRVLARSGVWREETLAVAADIRPLTSPFRASGMWPARVIALLVACTLALALWRERRRDRPGDVRRATGADAASTG